MTDTTGLKNVLKAIYDNFAEIHGNNGPYSGIKDDHDNADAAARALFKSGDTTPMRALNRTSRGVLVRALKKIGYDMSKINEAPTLRMQASGTPNRAERKADKEYEARKAADPKFAARVKKTMDASRAKLASIPSKHGAVKEAVAKIACLKCDEVSTSKAWQKNNGTCPKCKKSTQGVAEMAKSTKTNITEGDVVDFSMFAGQYMDGARAAFKGRDGKVHRITATGDSPRVYTLDGERIEWDKLKQMAQGMKFGRFEQGVKELDEDGYGASDADRNPSIERSKYGKKRPASNAERMAALVARDKAKGLPQDPSDLAKRKKMRDQFGESKKINEGVLDDMDDDGFLAKRQLYDLAKYSVALHRMIQDTDDLEPWIQAKITKAADYIDTVKHYMEYNGIENAEDMADEVGLDDIAGAVDTMSPEFDDMSDEVTVMPEDIETVVEYHPRGTVYESEVKAAKILKKMMAPLKGRK